MITVDDVIKEAVIVRNGPAAANTGGPGWYVESWATCDYAELPPEYAEGHVPLVGGVLDTVRVSGF